MNYVLYLNKHILLLSSVICVLIPLISTAKIKILSDFPVVQDFEKNNPYGRTDQIMHPRMRPSNFSGPAHLRQLMESCFTMSDDSYKYVLCPFSNITQEDTRSFYDSYKGIMGIWGEWEIKDNNFVAMRYIEGSPCEGGRYRTTKIQMKCGSKNKLLNVKEPQRCRYEAVFQTPLTCGSNSMLVYPRLPLPLQQQWDDLLQEYKADLYTEKGYKSELNKLFVEAGYLLHPDKRLSLQIKDDELNDDFAQSCEEQIVSLKKTITNLEAQLRIKEEYIKMLE